MAERRSLTEYALKGLRLGIQVANQYGAGKRGAQDAFFFGLNDRAAAGVQALKDKYLAKDPRSLRQLYAQRDAEQRAMDAYDEENYRLARRTGQVLGTVAGVATPGVGVASGATRLAVKAGAAAAPALARGAARGATVAIRGGAGSGFAGQAISDAATGNPLSPENYIAAMVGGASGGLTTRAAGAGTGGVVDGAVSELVRGALNGEVNIEDVMRSARWGGLAGQVGGLGGAYSSKRLDWRDKGKLGDSMSEAKSWLLADPVARRQVRTARGRTRLDFESELKREIEAKFGYGAQLSRLQRAELPNPNYQIDHFLPEHVGQVAGVGLSSVVVPTEESIRQRLREDRNSSVRPDEWFL